MPILMLCLEEIKGDIQSINGGCHLCIFRRRLTAATVRCYAGWVRDFLVFSRGEHGRWLKAADCRSRPACFVPENVDVTFVCSWMSPLSVPTASRGRCATS